MSNFAKARTAIGGVFCDTSLPEEDRLADLQGLRDFIGDLMEKLDE